MSEVIGGFHLNYGGTMIDCGFVGGGGQSLSKSD